jgi:hypothetical protein
VIDINVWMVVILGRRESGVTRRGTFVLLNVVFYFWVVIL